VDFLKALLMHIEKYPKMQASDLVKLAYQSEFGPGHLISNPALAEKYLYNEIQNTEKNKNLPLYEEIGDGYARINLGALTRYRITPKMVFSLFSKSAKATAGTRAGFDKKLEILLSLQSLPFPKNELADYLESYLSPFKNDEIPPPVSHSSAYRDAYKPHYRVIRLENLKERHRKNDV
jgi:hypothetical protein